MAIAALAPARGGTTPLTAYTGLVHRASILRAGFQYHIEKPVDARALVGVVAILALKELRRGACEPDSRVTWS